VDEALRYLVQSQPPAYLLPQKDPGMLIEASWQLVLGFASKTSSPSLESNASKYVFWTEISAFVERLKKGGAEAKNSQTQESGGQNEERGPF